MRQLTTPRHAERGLTLIELVASLAITTILLGMAAPFLFDTVANGQMREGGNLLLTETLNAQREAVKRNVTTRVAISGSDIQVLDMSQGADGTVVRSRRLAEGLSATTVNIDFNSRGAVLPLGTDVAVNLAKSGLVCSADLRCPGLRVDGGGGVRLCADQLSCP